MVGERLDSSSLPPPRERRRGHGLGSLGLHELAVGDALGPHQRPKLDHYATHDFLVCHAVTLDDGGTLTESEIDAVFRTRWLVTVRKGDAFPLDPVLERWDRSTDALRDLVSTIVETNLSLRDYRTIQIAKQVPSWAAIIAVPTLITAWFGMNVPYPGFGTEWGVWVAATLVVAISGGAVRDLPAPGLVVAGSNVRA